MPNIFISGLPLATLPLDGPNSFFEVQTIEAGITVSRKIAADDINISSAIVIEDEGVPLAGGATTLDFVGPNVVASGAGSTKTITISGGGVVNSVVGGVNISVNAGDPINPVVNLDAAITGVSVNGVTLNDGGAASDYLNETGVYNSPTNGVVLSSAGAATDYLDETGAYSEPAGSGISGIISTTVSRVGILSDRGQTVGFTGANAGQTMTIPANGAVAYPIGTLLGWDNDGVNPFSIAITTDTLIFADDASTGTRSLAAGGAAVAQKIAATRWKIAGAGLS
jgi:hypothetical protein